MASSNGQEQVQNLKQVVDSKKDAAIILTMLGRTFQLVMTTMTTTTVGDPNTKQRFSRFLTWIELVLVTSCSIANIAAITYSVCCDPVKRDYGFPWRLSIPVLLSAYLAVSYLAVRYLSLFVPQPPFAAWQALLDVAFVGIGGAAVGASCVVILFFHQPWLHIHFACLLALLIAAVVALWVWLARTYRRGGIPVSVPIWTRTSDTS